MKRTIIVFLKLPQLGQVKPRLAATMGDDFALAIYHRLVSAVLRQLSPNVEVVAQFEPPESESEVRKWLGSMPGTPALTYRPQAVGDCGEKRKSAFRDAFAAGSEEVVAIDTDCVELDAAIWAETWSALGHSDVVIGPSENGGYYMIGMVKPRPELFDDIPWRTPRMFTATLEKAAAGKLDAYVLPLRAEVDSEEDWNRVRYIVNPDARKNLRFEKPITFKPLFMERVWGGRRLAELYGKDLPPGAPVGESWEIVDRPEAQSIVTGGATEGTTLHQLWKKHRVEVFGENLPDTERFPLLFKLLDAREKLSVQVHPPAAFAPALGGEPKTEMWYVLNARPDAELYAGLAAGATRAEFENALAHGTCSSLLHRLQTKPGDAIFIPSGRIHAIGGGNVIFEAQQNSDTTYRVFDWNRVGLDGKPRELHIAESLQSIAWDDITPRFSDGADGLLAQCEHFAVTRHVITHELVDDWPGFAVFMVASGAVALGGVNFKAGEFFLRPCGASGGKIQALTTEAVLLRTVAPTQG